MFANPSPPYCSYHYRFSSESQRERERERETLKPERARKKRVMEGGHGWHVASLRSTGLPDKKIMNREMLRFRPIAPKPVAGGGSGSSYTVTENKSLLVSKARTKRKYVRVHKNNNEYKRKKMVSEEEMVLKTLQLLPEKAEMEDLGAGDSWSKVDDDPTAENNHNRDPQMLLNDKKWVVDNVEPGGGSDLTVEMGQMRVVESWVTVESVTDTCMDVRWLGSTDVEKMKNLERDTCPGFVSDGLNRVQWVNEAYKRMVMKVECDGQSPECECLVRLVVKVKFPYSYQAFTGRVRLQHTWRNQKSSKVVPCDVWRMDCGGFSWRLDVKAALSLGL